MATILIVDDRATDREFLATLLKYAGHHVLEAADGAEALDIVWAQRPALVISEVLMHTMDGVEFANRLHANLDIASVPVIFYTATYGLTWARKLAQSCGVSQVLAKPAKPQAILDAVAAALGIEPAIILPERAHRTLGTKLPTYLLAELQQRLQKALDEGLELIGEGSPMREGSDRLVHSYGTVQALSFRLAALLELGLVLSSERDPQQLLKVFCRASQDIMKAKYAMIGIEGNDRQPSRFVSSGMNDAELKAAITLLNCRWGILTKVLADGKPRRMHNPETGALRLALSHPAFHSVLVVRVLSRTGLYGWLCFCDKLGAEEFNDDDEQFAMTLAAQLGPMYENLVLYEEVQQHAGQLEVEVVERKHAAKELRESEMRFRQLAENIHEVFFLIDPKNTQMLYVSPAYEEIWGRSCESLYARPRSWIDSIYPEDLEIVRKGNEERDERGRFDYNYRIVRPDTSIRWIRARGFPIFNDAGEFYRIAGIAGDITEQVRLEEALRDREAGLHRAQVMNKLGHVITGPDGSFVNWSDTLCQLIGLDSTGVPKSTREWLNLVHPDDRAMFRDCCILAGVSGKRKDVQYRLRRTDGAWIHLRQVMEPLGDQPGPEGRTRWFNTIQDITERKEQQERIARLSRIYAVLSGINSAIVRIRDRNELFQEACRIAVAEGAFKMAWIGVIDPDTLDGKVVAWFGGEQDYVDAIRLTARAGTPDSDRPACVAVREMSPVICNDIRADPTLAQLKANSIDRGYHAVAAFPLIVEKRAVAVLTLFAGEVGLFDEEEMKLLNELAGDIAFSLQYIEKEEKLSYLAFYDALTGLPNSTLFRDRLTQFVNAAERDAHIVALILIDLDRFTHLNTTFGRHVGDMLLRWVADKLTGTLPGASSLARISADTFAVAVSNLEHGASDAALIVRKHIFEPLGQPFTVDNQEIRISARAGISLYPADGLNADTLFKNAEAALKQAKSSGETYLYYMPEMNAKIEEKLALEGQLRKAVELGQFILHYQPKVDLSSGHIVGAEALLRWLHPEMGMVPPLQFIPLAEENGLIEVIGEWVLQTACSQNKAWQDAGLPNINVSVNLSARQFKQRELVQIVANTLQQTGLAAHCLELEITENLMIQDTEQFIAKLGALKALGVKLSIDDFGTGYSSLSYLKRFPIDQIKVDQSFVRNLTTDPQDAAIARAVISLGHSLHVDVVAEGVETEAQIAWLRRHRCEQIQGYYFSPGVPAEDFAEMLRQHKSLPLSSNRAHDRTLLILDDDVDIAASVTRLLRKDGYRILAAETASEAFELLALNDVQVILCDQRMPLMSGAEFLSKVRNLYPEIIRIILSGHTEFSAVIEAVNRGAVYRFLTKPWVDEELRESVREAFHHYWLTHNETV